MSKLDLFFFFFALEDLSFSQGHYYSCSLTIAVTVELAFPA